MEEKESKPFRYNNKIYKSVIEGDKTLIQREDRPSPRASTTNFVNIGSYDKDGKFSPTDKATDDEQKNNKDLVKESKKSLTEAGITENQPFSITLPKEAYTTIEYRNIGTKSTFLKYPQDISDDQDHVQFSVYEYNPESRSLSTLGQDIVIAGVGGNREDKKYKRVDSTPFVVLPITKISDTNSVDWLDDRLSEIQRVFANASLDLARSGNPFDPNNLGSIDGFKDLFQEGSPATTAIKVALAGQAVQVNNLLTRSTGAILNNNIELLFNGPQLRQFSFAFDLFAKDNKDATAIKDIIYFFKSNMAVRDNIGELGQLGSSEFSAGVFLNSPYVFKIRYMRGKISNRNTPIEAKEHQSIGRIKTCALQTCTVDYTPMGSYMTFNDTEATMVMYRITLQFKELTPIYASDYGKQEGETSIHTIGY